MLRNVFTCKRLNIPYLCLDAEHCELTAEEIQSFYREYEIHSYTEGKDVVYVGNGYVGLHAATAGKKLLKLPRPLSVTPIFGVNTEYKSTSTISFEMKKNATALFRTEEVIAAEKCENTERRTK